MTNTERTERAERTWLEAGFRGWAILLTLAATILTASLVAASLIADKPFKLDMATTAYIPGVVCWCISKIASRIPAS